MAFRMIELIQETTTTTNGASPVTTYALSGSVTQRNAFSGFGNGDTTLVLVTDKASPPLKHTFIGTYNTGANTISVTTTLKGTGVWAAGTRNIWVTPLDEPMSALIAAILPGATAGFMVNDAAWSIQKRSINWAAGSLTDDFVVDTNNNGSVGNPTFTQQYEPLARNTGATSAQRTMGGQLILGATADQLKFSTSPLKIYGPNGTVALEITQNGSLDFSAKLSVDGAQVDLFTAASFTYDQVITAETADNTLSGAGIQSGTTLSVPVPSSGDYRLVLMGDVHWDVTNCTLGDGTIVLDLDEKIAAGSFAMKRSAIYRHSIGGSVTIEFGGVAQIKHAFTPTPGVTYQYRLSPTFTGNNSDEVFNADAGDGRYHSLIAMLTRVG